MWRKMNLLLSTAHCHWGWSGQFLHCALVDQVTAGGCWCPEAGSGCWIQWVSDVQWPQSGLAEAGPSLVQGLHIPAPDLETRDRPMEWRLGSRGWCLASSHYLHPPASTNQRPGLGSRDLSGPIRGQSLVTVCIIWVNQLVQPRRDPTAWPRPEAGPWRINNLLRWGSLPFSFSLKEELHCWSIIRQTL